MGYLIALLVISALGDALTTIRFLKDGSDTEANPRGRWFQDRFGIFAGTLLAKALQVGLIVGCAILADHWLITPGVIGIGALLNVWQALDNLD